MEDQLLIDSATMDEVQENKKLAVLLYDYQKAYDIVRHNWMIRVFTWMGYPSKLINVLKQLMDGWKTKLEVNYGGEIKTSRWIRILKDFQGDSYLPVGFCLTEVPITMLLDETEGYKVSQPRRRCIKRMHTLTVIANLKVYQENHQKLEIANDTIVKASMDTGACYGVKKCAEIVLRKGKMVKGEGLPVLEEKMEALDPGRNDVCKFLGCEQSDDTDVKKVLERVKKEIKKGT